MKNIEKKGLREAQNSGNVRLSSFIKFVFLSLFLQLLTFWKANTSVCSLSTSRTDLNFA